MRTRYFDYDAIDYKGCPEGPFTIINSETIKSVYSGKWTTQLKLADPPEGFVWIMGKQKKVNKKTLEEMGLTISKTINVNYVWYYLVSDAEINRILVPYYKKMISWLKEQYSKYTSQRSHHLIDEDIKRYEKLIEENEPEKIELGSSEWVHDILRRFGEIEIFVDIIEVVKEMNEQEETPDCLHNGPQDHELATVEKYVEWTEGVCGNCFFANGCQWYVDLFAEEYNY